MSSLHTKYRPATFDEVLGQDQAVKSLKKVVKDNRAHSFIFTGPSGTGKTTLARILAHEFAGKETSVAIEEYDAASKSGADDIRDVINRSQYRALGASGTKAFIIDEAHRLSGAAWTVFLKAIEEPAKHVYWMFCTTEAAKIPKTIGTRCLRYDLNPVKEEYILELLVKVCDAEKFDISDDILEAISEASGGSPRQSLVYLEACLYCDTAAEARNVMRTAGQSKEVIDIARFIIGGQGKTWANAMALVSKIDGLEAEGARIVIVNYLATVLKKAKSDKEAVRLLGLVEAFSKAYNTSDKQAPLLLSIGFAIGLDQ